MYVEPTRNCWRCGGPVYDRFFGYNCPYCTQLKQFKATQKLVKLEQQRQKAEYKTQPVQYMAPTVQYNNIVTDNDVAQAQPENTRASDLAGTIISTGVFLTLIYYIGLGLVYLAEGTWLHLVYPILHIVTFGLL